MKKKQKYTGLFITKPVYLGLSILELSKILTYEFCYDYVKAKYGVKAKLYYMDTDITLYFHGIHNRGYLKRYCRKC